MENKLILVSYVNVRNIAAEDMPEYLDGIANLTANMENVMPIIVPIRDGETRVECINPVLLTEEKYKEVAEKVDEMTTKFNEWLESIKKDENNN